MFIINPGTGPVDRANVRSARANIRILIKDLNLDVVTFRETGRRDEGRYEFVLRRKERTTFIEMPGIPANRVRWLNLPEQNIWRFPRLYVDGNSWVWFYAIDMAREALKAPVPKRVRKDSP